jgi:F-type H+-transporting ATPase subunit alpha
LEAFAKFGSDLDAATQLTIDRGRRNQEILKQPQFTPSAVEDQVAIIYASTKGLIDKIPVDRVREFEKEFITILRATHADSMNDLKAGNLSDRAIASLKKVTEELSSKY